jgi:predicted ArsR family transcriptional regulator
MLEVKKMSNELTEAQNFRVMHYTGMAELIRGLHEKFGDEVYKTVAKLNGDKAFNEWKGIAEKNGNNSIDELIKLLWEPLKNEGFQYEVVEKNEAGVQLKCTYCPIVDLAKHFGITKEGLHMFCQNDFYIAEGFNPKIGLKRTKTLMEGHDCCDHFYYVK